MKYDTEIKPEYHPIANLEPMMQEAELDLLVASMKRKGYDKRKPITMYEGKILDGRNRYVAAEHVGIKAHTIEFKGTYEEAVAESIDLNNARRHKSPSQKAMSAAYAVYINREEREANKQKILEANPKIGINKLAVENDKTLLKLTAKDATKIHSANPEYVNICLKFLREDRFDISEMMDKIFNGEIEIYKANARYKNLLEAYRIASSGADITTEEEDEVNEYMYKAKESPRWAALEIVNGERVIRDLKETRVQQDEYISELEELASEVSVLRSVISDIAGDSTDEGDW